MTQKMPTRSSTPTRKRDWGTTPVLFSLKNVQPMLVTGPARPEGNVAAPSSIADTNVTSNSLGVPAAAMANAAEETRVKPQPAPLKNFSYQNWIATALVVLLILFVIRISITSSPKDGTVAGADEPAAEAVSTKEGLAAKPELKGAELKGSEVKGIEFNPSSTSGSSLATSSPAVVPMLTLDGPGTGSGMSPSPLLVPATIPPATVPPAMLAPSESPSLELASNGPNPFFGEQPASSPTSPFAPAPAEPNMNGAALVASTPNAAVSPFGASVGAGPSASNFPSASTFPAATQEVNLEAGKPQMQIGPATPTAIPSNNMSGSFNSSPVSTSNDVAVNIQHTLTPDKPLAAFTELYEEAKRFNGQAFNGQPYGNASYGSVPATPVSTSGQAAGYQPVYNSNVTAQPTMNSGTTGTQLSGQTYPPTAQPYQPINVQDANGMQNRYQPIRQPGVSGAAAPAAPTAPVNAYVPTGIGAPSATQTPYVPVGSTTFPAQ